MHNIKINRTPSITDHISKCFDGLQFDEESHTYTYNKKKLISTSTYIKKRFANKFKAYYLAKIMAKNHNRKCPQCKERDPFYYIYRWKHESEQSINAGSRVHNYAEFGYPLFLDPPVCEQEKGVIDFFSDLPKKYSVLFLELRMYMKDYLKAGTADGILLNKETNKIVIIDYKTNTKNLHQCYKGGKLRGCFSHLYDCDLNKYCIQLNDYHNMIEMVTGIEVEEKWIIHFSTSDIYLYDLGKDSDKYIIDDTMKPYIVKPRYKIYQIPDYTELLKKDYDLWITGQ